MTRPTRRQGSAVALGVALCLAAVQAAEIDSTRSVTLAGLPPSPTLAALQACAIKNPAMDYFVNTWLASQPEIRVWLEVSDEEESEFKKFALKAKSGIPVVVFEMYSLNKNKPHKVSLLKPRTWKGARGWTLLHYAAQLGNARITLSMLRVLGALGHDVDPQIHEEHTHPGCTPLHLAIQIGAEETTKLLLDAGADLTLESSIENDWSDNECEEDQDADDESTCASDTDSENDDETSDESDREPSPRGTARNVAGWASWAKRQERPQCAVQNRQKCSRYVEDYILAKEMSEKMSRLCLDTPTVTVQ